MSSVRLLSAFCVVFAALFSVGESSNILCVFHVPSKSVDILGRALAKHLADIGHNVTYISAFPHQGNVKNFHSIQVEKIIELKDSLTKYVQGNGAMADILKALYGVVDIAKMIFEDQDVQRLIKSDSEFDVMIHLTGLDASMALAHRFNVPVVVFLPISALPVHNQMMANPEPTSYIPSMITSFDDSMSFFQRVLNTIFPTVFFNVLEIGFNYMGNKAIKLHFAGYPALEVIKQRADLILVNTHISTETPRPYVPNIVQIGGFHLQKPEPLSADLKQVLDESKEGFVYFSFGTNVNVKNLPQNLLNVFKESLGKLPLTIIMKYEDDTMPDQPSNFYLRKWFPQPSVLAHRNAKLFISHGGYGGTTESLHYGVPLVCIPFYGDQSKNCADAERSGYSVTVDFETVDEKTFSDALSKVLYNETFKNNIAFKSNLYRDQPMNPMDKAVYWIEHVIKHKGAKHLKVKGIYLPWYQYHLIDVYLFLGFVILLVLSTCYYSCKFVCRFACRKLCPGKRKVKTN